MEKIDLQVLRMRESFYWIVREFEDHCGQMGNEDFMHRVLVELCDCLTAPDGKAYDKLMSRYNKHIKKENKKFIRKLYAGEYKWDDGRWDVGAIKRALILSQYDKDVLNAVFDVTDEGVIKYPF